jgi:hypothetical protein
VDEAIGDALLMDNLMVSVVHCDDIVPRLSRHNIQNLAIAVNKFALEASTFQKEDTKTLEEYTKNYGLAGDMGDDDVSSKASTSSGEGDEKQPTQPLVESTPEQKQEKCIVEQEQPLVVPGNIVHLTFCNASYNATLCDHRLAALRIIVPLTSVVKDHAMTEHLEALRSLKLKQATVPIRDGPNWEHIYNQSTQQWTRCHICQSDPLWPYITKSEPTRGIVSHNCRSCGRVCCSVCAPAGDTIPADGIGKFQKLEDNKLSLPFIGLTGQQRVCTICFIHSYDKIQA